jgi:amino acid adenylation domain-containing protein/FkbM family methyltransferase
VNYFSQLESPATQASDGGLGGVALSPEERRKILTDWNATSAPYPRDQRLHQLFEEQVSRTPDAPAAAYAGETLSYQALDRRAETLARVLAREGVTASSLVPLCLERSLEMVAGIFGILKAGGAYVPLEPDLPDDRLGYLLRDTSARVVLTQARFADRLTRLAEGRAKIIAIDWDWARKAAEVQGQTFENEGSPSDPIYVIYTSGTTGRPKGVVLEHQALCNRIVWMQHAYRMQPLDRVLQKTPYSFDVSGWEFFWPLTTGACLVFAKPGGHKDPHYLRRIIQDAQITVLHFVPSMLRAFLLAEGGDCPSLRQVICSGEALPVALKDLFFEHFPRLELDNLYGPTEAAIDVTAYRCRKEDRLVPIGKPVANTRIYLVDETFQPVPVGGVGELCIAGECLARGYLNQPELTAEKFVKNPFQPGARMYRTGDLARWLPDGNIEYLGRADHQIKIRGNRVELGEIEAVILEQAGVAACAVVATGGELENLKLAAYVAPDPAQASGVCRQLELAGRGRLDGHTLHRLENGLEVAHLNASETDFLYREIFVNQTYLRHGIRLEAGDTVLDVGANIGMFSLSLFLGYEGLKIHAFEPIPEIHQVLALNAELFGGGWTAHACGLSETSGTEDFTYYPHLTMVSGAAANQAEEMAVVRSVFLREQSGALSAAAPEEIDGLIRNRLESRTVRCELRTLSEVIREQRWEVIHLLKIDVEKLEERVLRGIQDGDWAKIRQLVIEVHDAGGRVERIAALLAGKGFEVSTEQDDLLGATRIFQVYARRARPEPERAPVWKTNWLGQAEYVRRIREAARAKLPEYMAPAVIVPLAQLPLTANGKLDRKALAQRPLAASGKKKRVLPRSEIEERLTGIWEELLGIVDIGAEDGFFDLGGNSLLAVRVADRISKEFGCRYTVVSLLQHARIREISDYLAALQGPARIEVAAAGARIETRAPASGIAAVEAALNRHPAIRRGVVVNRRDGRGGETRVAFAIPNEDYFRARNAATNSRDRLDQWVAVWEKNYQPILGGEASSTERVNSIGYVRSDSGARIPEAELRESIDLVIRQVMAHQPKCILEIGCGTGMLLFPFVKQVERYLATDLSRNAIEHIQASLKGNPHADRVACFHCDASHLEAVPVETADLVVINSAAQYFPGVDYLTSLLESLARRLPPKARIFIGDVRDLRLLRMFHAWTLQRQCPPGTTKQRFRRLLADRIKLEKELVLHPAYFRHLQISTPRIRQVLIEPKPGKFQNEFVRFRFDVWLCLDEQQPEGVAPRIYPWNLGAASLDDWARTSGVNPDEPGYLKDIPNRRLWKERALLDWLESPGEDALVSELLAELERQPGQGIEPSECLAWAEAAGMRATLHWEHAREDGRFELYLRPGGQTGGELPDSLVNRFADLPARQFSNHPSLMLDWEEHVPVLKAALQAELGDEPLPAKFLLLQEFPRLANGEIDRDELAGRKAKPLPAKVPDSPAIRLSQPPEFPAYYNQSLAIIGISCAFPGAAQQDQFWQNLRAGIESVRYYSEAELRALGVPEERIRNPRFVPMRRAIEGGLAFDADFFHLPPRQAENMDPQARRLITHAWQAMEDAGYAAGSIPDTAVFMSAANNYYPQSLGLREADLQGVDGHEAGLFGQPGMIPGWISYHLGLKGPSLFVQSLCCSSMTGLHLACRSLLNREASYALVGAASLFAPDRIGYLYEPGLILSPDGHCRPFDAAAGGMVEGEGVCVVLLKRAADALRDRDHIYALLRGIGVGNDGAEKAGFNAPSLAGQTQAIRKALSDTGVPVESIRYVEAHGNGTPLGDAIEVSALSEVYARGPGEKPRCGLGSTKPNIGNVDTVSGLAGCVKIALSLGRRCFPPVPNFHTPNPNIQFADSPFYVVERPETWLAGDAPVRIAQHVYSNGGMNAHAIYEEYREPAGVTVDAPQGPVLVPLSARNEDRLRAYARQWVAFLKARPMADPEADARYLLELAYTLQIGRQAMEHRAIFMVRDLGELTRKLAGFANGSPAAEGVFQGVASRAKDLLQLIGDERDQRTFAQQRIAEGRWDRVAQLWVRGAALDWRSLYGARPPFRASLPTYPFAEKEYRLEPPERTAPKTVLAAPPLRAPALVVAGAAPNWADALLRRILGDMLKVPEAELDGDRPFIEAGLDSVGLIRFTNRLNEEKSWELSPTALFTHATLNQLARHLTATYPVESSVAPNSGAAIAALASGQEDTPAPRATTVASRVVEPIAIVGMSGRFPQAGNLEAFWENLNAGRDCVREIPPERWARGSADANPEAEAERAKVRWGGYLEGIDEFDPLFFNLSPREAERMDPQNRLLMTHVWLAMEDAGYSASSLSGTRSAIFIGTGETGYEGLVAEENGGSDYDFLGLHPFAGPNRMSYFLDLKGPSEPVNTGCSSALVAVHKAVEALQNGGCDLAFAGGVNTVPIPGRHLSYHKAGLICASGRCQAFSSQANGFVWGEGVGVIALKRLRDAEAAGDPIHAVILGSAQNHGGRANSFTAPNPAAQAQVVESALRKAGVDPRTIGFIETHGAGTKLGDPVEIEGLKQAFRVWSEPNGEPACGLGSVKSMIGHLEFASGIVGLIKTVLQLRHRTLIKNLHCEELNPYLQLAGSPFYVVRENAPWPVFKDGQGRELPRRAGVSSFGLGGVNAHVVIEEYIPRPATHPSEHAELGSGLVVLSAKKPEALREAALRLRDFLSRNPGLSQAEWRSLAYTLQVGRDAMRERLGLLASSARQLEASLGAFLENDNSAQDWFLGRAPLGEAPEGQPSDALADLKDGRAWLEFWVKGGTVDWNRGYRGPRPARMSLPGYPFARERYWAVVPHPTAPVAASRVADANLHAVSPTAPEVCLLEKIWREKPLSPGASEPSGSTLVLVNEDSILLAPSIGGQVIVVGNQRVPAGQADFTLDFRAAASGERVAERVVAVCAQVTRVVDLSDLYRQPRTADESKLGKLALYQALAGTFTPRRILWFTQGLQSFDTARMSLAGAKFIGLIKMLGSEYSHLSARAIDLDSRGPADSSWLGEVARAEFGSPAGEVEVCYRDRKRYAPRLVAGAIPASSAPFIIREQAAYVVTGGTRGIGLEIARHLVALGARKLALLGIQPLPPKKAWERTVRENGLSDSEREKLNGLIELDRSVDELCIYTGSLSNLAALRAFFDTVRTRCGPIKGVVHSAGAYPELNSRAFVTRDLARMQSVFEPKMDGLEALHEIFADEALDFLVTFSSLSGVIPRLARGLSDYAMANTFADHFAAYQFHQCRRAHYRTISWVDWDDVGYATRMTPPDKERLEQSLGEVGLAPFSARAGCRLFDLAMRVPNRSWVLPCHLAPEVFQTVRSDLLSSLSPPPASQPSAPAPDPAFLARLDRQLECWRAELEPGAALAAETLEAFASFEELKRLDPVRIARIHDLLFPKDAPTPAAPGNGAGQGQFIEVIRRHLVELLKLQEVDNAALFQDYGLTSISGMVLTNRLGKELKHDVEPGWLIDFPTVESLAAHLETQARPNRD